MGDRGYNCSGRGKKYHRNIVSEGSFHSLLLAMDAYFFLLCEASNFMFPLKYIDKDDWNKIVNNIVLHEIAYEQLLALFLKT